MFSKIDVPFGQVKFAGIAVSSSNDGNLIVFVVVFVDAIAAFAVVAFVAVTFATTSFVATFLTLGKSSN